MNEALGYGDMFPPRFGRASDAKKEDTVAVNFRAPKSLKEYLSRQKSGGHTETDVIIQSILALRDVVDVMGEEWWDVVKLSISEKKPYGSILGELALEALKARATKKR